MACLRFLFICQVVEQLHPIQATAVKWIECFARHPQVEEVMVIALRTGEFSLPDNVRVYPIQKRYRLGTLLRFYGVILRMLFSGRIDFFWVNQGGPYPLLLLPFKLLLRKPIYHWKAHPYISKAMKFYALFCDTKIFTCTANSFPMNLSKVKIAGHGIDVEKFRIMSVGKTGDIVTVGRIAPVKHVDAMLRMLAECRRRYGKSYRLDIYGMTLDKDFEYKEKLNILIQELNLSNQVEFKGAVHQDQLPKILNQYRVFMNFSGTALDKAVVEAMACGLPVISTNICVADILPEELKPRLFVPKDNLQQQAESLHSLLSQREMYLAEIGKRLREVAVQDHSIKGLVENVLTEIGESR